MRSCRIAVRRKSNLNGECSFKAESIKHKE
jgi:hypothetical protein